MGMTKTVSTHCQCHPADRRITLRWDPADVEIPQNAFVAGTFKAGSVYIGRYEVDGDTVSGPVIEGKGLIYLSVSNENVTSKTQIAGFEVLVIEDSSVAEWVRLENHQWPSDYTPILCGKVNSEVTLIGRVRGVGVGLVTIHSSGKVHPVCYIPRFKSPEKEPIKYTDNQFQLLCVK